MFGLALDLAAPGDLLLYLLLALFGIGGPLDWRMWPITFESRDFTTGRADYFGLSLFWLVLFWLGDVGLRWIRCRTNGCR
jgi:hypothetical protein